MRVILHRIDEMEDISTPSTGVEIYNKVKDVIAMLSVYQLPAVLKKMAI